MAVTNVEIILRQSIELMQKGILKPTGRVFTQELPDGTTVELPEPEPIHTYNGWKELGYQVKKGEHAKASFPIWKCSVQKNPETGEEVAGKCYQRNAFWFTFDQVEKIAGLRQTVSVADDQHGDRSRCQTGEWRCEDGQGKSREGHQGCKAHRGANAVRTCCSAECETGHGGHVGDRAVVPETEKHDQAV